MLKKSVHSIFSLGENWAGVQRVVLTYSVRASWRVSKTDLLVPSSWEVLTSTRQFSSWAVAGSAIRSRRVRRSFFRVVCGLWGRGVWSVPVPEFDDLVYDVGGDLGFWLEGVVFGGEAGPEYGDAVGVDPESRAWIAQGV